MADANDAWYTEDDNYEENGWNRMQNEFSNVGVCFICECCD